MIDNKIPCNNCGNFNYAQQYNKVRDWEFGVEGEYSYYKCSNCSLVRLDPFPTTEKTKSYYPDDYISHLESSNKKGKLFDFLEKIHFNFFLKNNFKFLKNKNLPLVLDIGSGNGEFLVKLSKFFSLEMYGIDFSKTACQNMIKKKINAYHGVFLDYPEKKKFDMISMNNYIEHVIDPLSELKKAHDCLNKGGKLIGITDNFDSIDRIIFQKYWAGNHAPRHTFLFSPKVLKETLKKAGFNNVVVKQDINPGQIVISIQNYFQRNKKDLANNPDLEFGRTKFYSYYLLLALPINILFYLFSKTGNINFYATKD